MATMNLTAISGVHCILFSLLLQVEPQKSHLISAAIDTEQRGTDKPQEPKVGLMTQGFGNSTDQNLEGHSDTIDLLAKKQPKNLKKINLVRGLKKIRLVSGLQCNIFISQLGGIRQNHNQSTYLSNSVSCDTLSFICKVFKVGERQISFSEKVTTNFNQET